MAAAPVAVAVVALAVAVAPVTDVVGPVAAVVGGGEGGRGAGGSCRGGGDGGRGAVNMNKVCPILPLTSTLTPPPRYVAVISRRGSLYSNVAVISFSPWQ